MTKPAVIKCPKCGYESNIISDVCIKCNTRLNKICGACGFSNSVEKNYCDQCGTKMDLKVEPKPGADAPAPPPPGNRSSEEPKPRLEMRSISDTVFEKDISYRSRAMPKPPPPPPAQPAATAPGSKLAAALKGGKAPAGPGKMAVVKKTLNILFTVALLGALIFILSLIAAPHIPKFTLVLAANRYLHRLSTGDYAGAYDMLSSNSKTSCSEADYVNYNKQYYSKVPPWSVRDVGVFAIEPDAAMIKYQLKEGTAPWRMDYISFVREHERWTRPYIWILFEPIETALAKQDYPQALFLAQRLYLTDPMDPRSSGYLCASEFFMGLYDKSADSCRKTIVASQTYPVGFNPDEMFWFKFYFAESLRFTQKFEMAMDGYDELLRILTLTPKEKCPLLLSRADTLVRMKKYDTALDSILKADEVCVGDVNKAEVKKRTSFLNGDAKQEAIVFAQRSKFGPDQPTLAEVRKKDLQDLALKLGPRNMRFMPKDNWIAAHLAGPEYRVVLRQEGINPRTKQKDINEVYSFMVNLWTGAIKIEKGLALPSEKQK